MFPKCRLGSSPRVRGTLARARLRGLPSVDHPRVCGEHARKRSSGPCCGGSSPRVRGTRVLVVSVRLHEGIIPACAGNTRTALLQWLRLGDHPRVCGEHIAPGAVAMTLLGSSPRVRGTLSRLLRFTLRTGIIPACAGNTGWRFALLSWCGDHPRVCGEHEY